MKKTILKITIACLILSINSSCTSQVILKNKKASSSKNMEALSVDEDFQYRNFQKITFDFLIENPKGEPISKALFSLNGIEKDGKENIFYSGITKQDGLVKIVLKVPHHFEKVQIEVSENNIIQRFYYPLESPYYHQKLIFK
ncbi:MAG: hypothetical protein ACI87N_002788 [Flavobacteriales bacterium]|jgi:hypothetical protein